MTDTVQIDPKTRFGESWERLFDPAVAHRGLWSPTGAPENSLAAFHNACAHGYGIELDVQLSADGEAMVFHELSHTYASGLVNEGFRPGSFGFQTMFSNW